MCYCDCECERKITISKEEPTHFLWTWTSRYPKDTWIYLEITTGNRTSKVTFRGVESLELMKGCLEVAMEAYLRAIEGYSGKPVVVSVVTDGEKRAEVITEPLYSSGLHDVI